MKQYVQSFQEKLVYNRSLNPNFWQGWEFDQDVRTTLLQIANDFYSDLKLEVPIIDVQLTGSMASYTWGENSDIDVHVVIDFAEIDENTDLVRDALLGKKFVWNLRHPVQIKGHDVELYIQDDDAKTISAGIFSLYKNEWLQKPTYKPPKVDTYLIAQKVEDYKKEIEELDKILNDDIEDDARLIFDRAKVLKKKISGTRDEGLQRDGEFSIENLVFKELRNQGYIGKLIKLQARAYSKIYSDEDFKPDQTKIMEEEMPNAVNEVQVRYDYFVNEVLTADQKDELANELRDIQQMISQGMIDKREFIAKRREIMRKVGGISNLVGDAVLGEVCMPELCEAMKSTEYRDLLEEGWYKSSTDKQLFNGTIALTTDYALRGGPNNWPTSIAVSSNGYVRRIWTAGPTGYRANYKHAHGEPQVLVNNLPGDGVDQYRAAFQWIQANINPESQGLASLPMSRRRESPSNVKRYRTFEE